jgi:anti-sigma regulatory factor (Ser/Thr protein kinase)
MKTGTSIVGRTTIPAQAQHVAAARAFVARTLGDRALADCALADTAVLLTSELVTNSVQHSHSRRLGGTITVTLITTPGGIRTEVADEGGATTPTMCPGAWPPELTEDGRGLRIVDMLADRWGGSWCEASGTVTWFELIAAVP